MNTELLIRSFLRKASEYNLKSKYDEFNKLYFDNELPDNIPVIWSSRLTRAGGQAFAVKKDGKTELGKIEMSSYHKLSELQLDTILIHEMIHGLMYQRQLKHINHGKLFKEFADKINKINPKIHAEGATLSNIGINIEEIEKNKLEIIPVYVLFICYDNFSMQNCREDCWFFSHEGDIDRKILNNEKVKKSLIVKRYFGDVEYEGYLYKINTNTERFLYKYFEKLLDKEYSFDIQWVKSLISAVKKDKDNAKFVKKYNIKMF